VNKHHNIQQLFSVISIGNFRQYLIRHGWQLRDDDVPERLYFDRIFAGGEQASTVWIWSSMEHPRYRNQVPNAIFTLSVLEDRPALDIANEIYASVEEKPTTTGETAVDAPQAAAPAASLETRVPPSHFHRLVYRLADDRAFTLIQDMLADTVHVSAGEIVELVYHGASNGGLEIELGADFLRAALPQAAGLRLLQGVSNPSVGEHWSARQIVCDELKLFEDVGDSKTAARLLEELHAILARIDFELDTNARIDDRQQQLLQRQTAVLAAALSRRVTSSPHARKLVWKVCAKLLFPVGLRLELRSTSADELFETAAADDEQSPKPTLTWIKENTVSVVS